MIATSKAGMRESLVRRMVRAREETDKMFLLVKAESLYERPITERHRIIFYLGHLEAFEWNLFERGFGLNGGDASLNRLFAFGIDPVDGELPSDEVSDWPVETQVRDYGQRIRLKLDEAFSRVDARWNGDMDPEVLLQVAIEHRLMHAETLAYMFHQLPLTSKHTVAQAATPAGHSFELEMIPVPAGQATLGLAGGDAFGWDNEFEQHAVNVPQFRVDRYKVTNGQFLEFTRAGGYQERNLWSESGWRWREQSGLKHPVFWKRSNDEYLYRGMFEEMPLPVDWPVYVSHAEASAYAAWAGKRLPTEAEWHRAAFGSAGGERAYPWGEDRPSAGHGYLDMNRWDPLPVNAFPDGRSYWGADGMIANGWEWTSSLFEPFAGFEPFSFYRGYSADFFDGKHFVMKGGSPRTEACMLRRSFRNWFQPHYPYAYAGFRCATSE